MVALKKPEDQTVSVCLAALNGEKYIREQIESILSQLSNDDELIVSDGGSTDQTMNILMEYSERVKIFDSVTRLGVVSNFEKAMRHACKKIIVLSDQDDVWLPGRLECIKKSLLTKDLVIMNASVVDADLRSLGFTIFDVRHPELKFWGLLKRNSFVGCCLAFDKDSFGAVLRFPSFTPMHDWLIAVYAVLMRREIGIVCSPYLLYRRHASNVTNLSIGESKRFSFYLLMLRIKLILSLAIVILK